MKKGKKIEEYYLKILDTNQPSTQGVCYICLQRYTPSSYICILDMYIICNMYIYIYIYIQTVQKRLLQICMSLSGIYI